MGHNNEAGGSRGCGFTKPANLTSEDAKILTNNKILVPQAWHLPHGWSVSATGYAVVAIPLEGPALDEYIE
jgi:hypothetical protein